jgi:hypothetical protein
MSKARAIIEDKQPSEGMKWYNWALSSSQQLTGYASIGAQFVRQNTFPLETQHPCNPFHTLFRLGNMEESLVGGSLRPE